VIERVAAREPFAFGEKVIETEQLLFAGRITPVQPSLEIVKSPALLPEIPVAMFDRFALPLLLSVATPTALPGIN
jgi:hypothetical protein